MEALKNTSLVPFMQNPTKTISRLRIAKENYREKSNEANINAITQLHRIVRIVTSAHAISK